jgi:hypothetical protein
VKAKIRTRMGVVPSDGLCDFEGPNFPHPSVEHVFVFSPEEDLFWLKQLRTLSEVYTFENRLPV